MTDTEIITAARALVRENDASTSAMTLEMLNRKYRSYARLDNWPQMLVRQYVITTTSGAQSYNLPSNFDRPAAPWVMYDAQAITGGYQNGYPIPFLNRGPDYSWSYAGVAGAPSEVSIGAASTTPFTATLVFNPAFTDYGKTVLLDYYKTPATLDGTGKVLEIPQLGETLKMALAAELSMFQGKDTSWYPEFRQNEMTEYRRARCSLLQTT